MYYERMLEFLELIHELDDINLLELCTQLIIELKDSSISSKENSNYDMKKNDFVEFKDLFEMIKKLDNVDLLVFCQQLLNELKASIIYVEEKGNFYYNLKKSKECLEDLSNIISKIEIKIINQRIIAIVTKIRYLDERTQLIALSKIEAILNILKANYGENIGINSTQRIENIIIRIRGLDERDQIGVLNDIEVVLDSLNNNSSKHK